MVGLYSVKFHPLYDSFLAFTAGQHLINGGCLVTTVEAIPVPYRTIPFASSFHGLSDCSWSLTNPNLIVIATNLGSSHLVDVSQDPSNNPLESFLRNNLTETTSVDWQPNNDSFLSASSDGIVNHWSIDRTIPQYTNRSNPQHVSCVTWNPQIPNVYASTCYDGCLRIRDIRVENDGIDIPTGQARLSSCDWNCSVETCIATVSNCRTYINVWDINQPNYPIKFLNGAHTHGVLRVKFSPHRQYQIASSALDSRVALWDFGPEHAVPLVRRYNHHQRPVFGLDMSKLIEGQLASYGSDRVHVWQHAYPEA